MQTHDSNEAGLYLNTYDGNPSQKEELPNSSDNYLLNNNFSGLTIMVAYICHYLSDNYVDLSDLYFVLSLC